MAFDDTVGGSDSNSYVSVADFDDYVIERGVDIGSPDEATKEGWLIRATEYIDAQWDGQWKGSIASDTQALAWPREDVEDNEGREIADDVIPNQVKKATYEMAVYAKTYSDLSSYTQDGLVTEESATAGAVSSTKKYVNGSGTTYPYSNVGKIISPLLTYGFGFNQKRVVRS